MYPLQQSITALEYFSALVHCDEGFPLFEVAACLAHDEHPELNLAEMTNEMDHLIRRLELQISKTVEPLRKVQILNRFFYRECGFAPNLNHYHDSDNCYLSAVIRNRRGNSISLALIWMELAQAIGIKCALVCFNKEILIKVYLNKKNVLQFTYNGSLFNSQSPNYIDNIFSTSRIQNLNNTVRIYFALGEIVNFSVSQGINMSNSIQTGKNLT